MEFRKYSSIENSYQEKYLNGCQQHVPPDVEWIALEKIHGANFSIHIWRNESGEVTIKFAKRTSFLETEEDRQEFFDFTPIEHELLESATKVANIIPPGHKIIIYGELIGNSVSPELGEPWVIKRGMIQKDIPYTNKMAFFVFDMVSDNTYLPHTSVEKLKNYGFLITPTIVRGTLDECLAVEAEKLNSRVPAILGHTHTVEAEGIVIKPVTVHYSPAKVRLILKQKRKKFTDAMPKKPKEKIVPIEHQEIYEGLVQYANKTRIDSVISKEGPNLPKPRLYGLAVADIYETYQREHPDCTMLAELKKNDKAKKIINELLKINLQNE